MCKDMVFYRHNQINFLLFKKAYTRRSLRNNERKCETSKEEGSIAEGGAKEGGGAAEDNFDRGVMLGFEQREELEAGDATDMKGGIGEILTRQLLDNLDYARSGGDGTSGKVRLIDGTVRMERDAIDRSPTLAFGQGGLRCDVIEIIQECHKEGEKCQRVTR